jgi:hypothetical protein
MGVELVVRDQAAPTVSITISWTRGASEVLDLSAETLRLFEWEVATGAEIPPPPPGNAGKDRLEPPPS